MLVLEEAFVDRNYTNSSYCYVVIVGRLVAGLMLLNEDCYLATRTVLAIHPPRSYIRSNRQHFLMSTSNSTANDLFPIFLDHSRQFSIYLIISLHIGIRIRSSGATSKQFAGLAQNEVPLLSLNR